MTQQKAEPSAATGCLGLVVIVAALGAAGYYGLGLMRSKPATLPAPSTVSSALLGAALPGASAFPSGENREIVLTTSLNLARDFNLPCTTNQELYLLDDDVAALDAVNTAVQTQGFERTSLQASDNGAAFALKGPKALFVVTTNNALFLCEV
ncbi:hypothetical protein [Deinococcus multiflagellatus]|uniref:Uncharacterized protein n=1 Tax=Deinococcus multiflagellatus TaxID=1656887 RepID=A0ABW1ZGU5_9DEIO|nr:hypothetical protein [Deinococcus multiflagellatus]MBZ9713748.1 hypothetical protein [Deinococcus multiflagellatus]